MNSCSHTAVNEFGKFTAPNWGFLAQNTKSITMYPSNTISRYIFSNRYKAFVFALFVCFSIYIICSNTNSLYPLLTDNYSYQSPFIEEDIFSDENFGKLVPSRNQSSDMPKVYAYYDPISARYFSPHTELIKIWKNSWRQRGWEPVVLNKSIAQQHPLFGYYDQVFRSYPTTNHKEYELACYYRWIAMAVVGGGFLSDYDVMNIDFPSHPHAYKDEYKKPLTVYQGFVPALVAGTKEEYEKVVQEMATYKPKDNYIVKDKPHLSDMLILRNLVQEKVINALEGEDSPCNTYHLVHLANWAITRIKSLYGSKFGDGRAEITWNISKLSRQEAVELLSPVFSG